MTKSEALLREGALQLNVEIHSKEIGLLLLYMEEILEINKQINLTAITDREEFVIKHLLDSLASIPYMPKKEIKICDLGTGGGFPGVPLAIMRPQCQVTLMDSVGKKLKAVEDICKKMEITNIEFVHGRAEDIGHMPEYREKFDGLFSRAVAPMAVLAEYSLPLVKKGSYMVALKSEGVDRELEESKTAIGMLGGKLKKVIEYTLPFTGVNNKIILIEKLKHTPEKFPRNPGIPKKKPLGL
jgi:16S rRNA (guanine527-N7)-methyltransferase